MKNITVSVDDETYYRARLQAAARRTSVSALVRDFLGALGSHETEFDRLLRQEEETRASIAAMGPIHGPVRRYSRDELYDRTD